MPFGERWQELLNSDAELYAGSNVGNLGAVASDQVASHGQPLSLALNLPPLGVLVMKPA